MKAKTYNLFYLFLLIGFCSFGQGNCMVSVVDYGAAGINCIIDDPRSMLMRIDVKKIK